MARARVSWDDCMSPKKGVFSFISSKDVMKALFSKWIIQALLPSKSSLQIILRLCNCNLLTTVYRVILPYSCSPQISPLSVGPKFDTRSPNHGRWWQIRLHFSLHQFQRIFCNSICGGGWNTKVFTLALPQAWPPTLYRKGLRYFWDIWDPMWYELEGCQS